jgi:hypothetical protein
MPQYLDEPFALELAQLEEARTLLRTLAARPGPLPPYWRSRLARIALTLSSLRRDLARHARHTALEGIETTLRNRYETLQGEGSKQ